MGSANAVLRLILYLDPSSVGKVQVSREVFGLHRVGCRIRTDRCSGLLIDNSPSCDSRESRGRRRFRVRAVDTGIPRQPQWISLAVASCILIDGVVQRTRGHITLLCRSHLKTTTADRAEWRPPDATIPTLVPLPVPVLPLPGLPGSPRVGPDCSAVQLVQLP
jgi:hypothetical protein